jgi:hypothetical protein
MNSNSRGSEWRRWDLHIHTPGTQKNDKFEGKDSDEKWDNYYSDIENYIGDGSDPTKAIAAIGITDYVSVDNYSKVISDGRLPESVKLVLPNIELRVLPIASKSPVNIHCIFDPNIPNLIEVIKTKFLSKLSVTDGPSKTFHATKLELQELGRLADPFLDDDSAYQKGIHKFVIEPKTLIDLFNEDSELRARTLIVVGNNSKDGASGITCHADYIEDNGMSSQLEMCRQSIYKMCDAIFTAQPKDVSYFLGRGKDSAKVVIQKCKNLMPCIHGSDAHKNIEIFEPYGKRFCWIKADITFNGLKQIIYEPEERVRISATQPERKSPYMVIDSITFDDDDFQKTPILLNDKLTCIIGGKSTGKSILIHNLAKTLDPNQVAEKIKTSTVRTRDNIPVTIKWQDGATSTSVTSGDKKIIYIPQTYLNRLCDATSERTEIDSIIQHILLQDKNLLNNFDTMNRAIADYKPKLHKKIVDCLEIRDSIAKISSSMKECGDKTSITKEKERLVAEKDRLAKESSLSDEEITAYDNAVSDKSSVTQVRQAINDQNAILLSIDTLVEATDINYELGEKIVERIKSVQQQIISNADAYWHTERNSILASLSKSEVDLEANLQCLGKIILTLSPKIQDNKAIAELSDKIKIETEKLLTLETYEKEKCDKEQRLKDSLKDIVGSADFFELKHREFADFVNNNDELKTDDLLFSVEVPFKIDAFAGKMKNLMDNKSKIFKETFFSDSDPKESYTKDDLFGIATKVLNGTLVLKKGNTLENALRDIFDDWFEVKYRVKMDNDSIDVMSPGKKALVLLKLVVDLAQSTCPILIDQPEDDLDNRSIFNELIPFIKKKKKERQIIIVTHNANVVLGADAEEVIVANQKGTNSPNNKFRFEYVHGAIEDNTCSVDFTDGILNRQGIQQHICDILEGGKAAFELRKRKYRI